MEQADRVQALAALQQMEQTLAQMAGWFDDEGYPRVAVLLEDAWRDVCAAQHLTDRDVSQVKLLVPDGRALAPRDSSQRA